MTHNRQEAAADQPIQESDAGVGERMPYQDEWLSF